MAQHSSSLHNSIYFGSVSSNFQKSIEKALITVNPDTDSFFAEKSIRKEVSELIEMYPGSPSFLGKVGKYPKPKKSFFLFDRRDPDLSELRNAVCRPIEKLEAETPRQKIAALLKKFDYLPDVHALHAIQIYNDCVHSGLENRKLQILKGALVKFGRAIVNGGGSIFNITWFVKIYIKYLEMLRDRYGQEYRGLSNHHSHGIRLIASDLQKVQIQLMALLSVRDKLGGLNTLNSKMQRSRFYKESISHEEILKASIAILHGFENRMITDGKTAKSILWVLLTHLMLFAKMPIFSDYVAETLAVIPDQSRDLILQKFMVTSMETLTGFRLAFSYGDIDGAKTLALDLFGMCKALIDRHLENALLTKPYEIDPFLKAAWIVREIRGLFPERDYRKLIDTAVGYLDIVLGSRGKLRNSKVTAINLHSQLTNIRIELGWQA